MKPINIKNDITFLQKNPKIRYFDSACVSLKPKVVVDAINEYYDEYPGCGGGRSGHALGVKTSESVEQARIKLKKFFGAKKAEEIIFTRNTTEGLNLVANSFPFKHKTILTSDKEHNSNYVPWIKKSKQGFNHLKVSTNNGVINKDEFTQLLENNDVDLVALNHISNLDGIENPIKELTKIAHKNGAKVLVDGAQSAGHMPVDVRSLSVDFFACSGHKMLGPSGIGMLYGTNSALEELDTFLVGGDTVDDVTPEDVVWANLPHRFEAGLQNYAGIAGFAAAATYLDKIGLQKIKKHCDQIRNQLEELFVDKPVEILGQADARTSIVSVIPSNMKAHELGLLLAKQGVYVRSGSFCVHSWYHKYNKPAAVRFSAHIYNTVEDTQAASELLNQFSDLL